MLKKTETSQYEGYYEIMFQFVRGKSPYTLFIRPSKKCKHFMMQEGVKQKFDYSNECHSYITQLTGSDSCFLHNIITAEKNLSKHTVNIKAA